MPHHAISKEPPITPAECMRRKRSALYAADFIQCKLQIPESFHARLTSMKIKYAMRGLDSVASAMIRKAMLEFSTHELVAPPPPIDFDKLKQITLHIPKDQFSFLKSICHRNRGVNLGVALETIGYYISSIGPSPHQISLFENF